jgi:hypothetical protein
MKASLSEADFMRKALSIAVILAGLSIVSACAKGPAEAALKAADAAVESVKADTERFAPEQFAALTAENAAAHELFNKGDYKGASEAARSIPAKAQEVLQAALARKDELTKTFTEIQGALPGMIAALTARATELAGKAPKGMDPAAFTAATGAVATLSQRWSEIAGAFQGGDVLAAVDRAKALKAEVEGLMSQLGVSAAPVTPAA